MSVQTSERRERYQLNSHFCFIGRWFVAFSLSFFLLLPQPKADPAHDFIVSCSYGVLAGTLVGSALLAFSSQPGDNLNEVARGASLGLYAGILLGAYVVYGVPSEDEDAINQLNHTKNEPKPPALQIYPLIGRRGVEGAGAALQVLSF